MATFAELLGKKLEKITVKCAKCSKPIKEVELNYDIIHFGVRYEGECCGKSYKGRIGREDTRRVTQGISTEILLDQAE